ncbi:MAG: P-loop NTPase fold protein [Microcoleaceae cyanobacterium]
MQLDVGQFFRASNPAKTLNIGTDEDRQYYIDFSSVRGGKLIKQIARTITILSPDVPTCQLFTGHIGSGKSTELLRLKAELEQSKFHVIYFESSRDLNMADVEVTDILLAIIRQVSESIESVGIELNLKAFQAILWDVIQVSHNKMDLSAVNGSQVHHSSFYWSESLSVAELIQQITKQAQNSREIRALLRQYLEPRTSDILEIINREMIAPFVQQVKQQGYAGVVIIIDNLDRIISSQTVSGRSQPEYLFIDRGNQLNQLACHVVYTIPLALIFSNDLGQLTNQFGGDPKTLPMVPVKLQNSQPCEPGIDLLRQLILTRAFPSINQNNYHDLVTDIFDHLDTLDRLCLISGGHVRSLLVLLYSCLQKEDPPISRDILEEVILQRRSQLLLAIEPEEWLMLSQVAKTKKLNGLTDSKILLQSLWVFEYRYRREYWFDVNPILKEADEFID